MNCFGERVQITGGQGFKLKNRLVLWGHNGVPED